MPEDPKARTRVLYLSPLRALAVDVEESSGSAAGHRLLRRNGSARTCTRRRSAFERATRPLPTVAIVRHPPDILITTPESLFLMLTSQARETLANVEAVIIDEIHAMAGHQAALTSCFRSRRLEELAEQSPQRIALSATQRPLDEIARFLGGNEVGVDGTVSPRPVTV